MFRMTATLRAETSGWFPAGSSRLRGRPRFRWRSLDQRDRRRTDIAAHRDVQSARSKNLAGQGGRGCFSVRSGDGDDRAWQGIWAASSISPITGSPSSARLHQRRRVHGNARADHDQVLSAESALAVAAGFDCDAVIEQDVESLRELVLRTWYRIL